MLFSNRKKKRKHKRDSNEFDNLRNVGNII